MSASKIPSTGNTTVDDFAAAIKNVGDFLQANVAEDRRPEARRLLSGLLTAWRAKVHAEHDVLRQKDHTIRCLQEQERRLLCLTRN